MQQSFSVTDGMEKILIGFASGKTPEIPDSLEHPYGGDLNFKELEPQLQILPRYIKASANSQPGTQENSDSEITIRTLSKLFGQSCVARRLMPDVDELLRIYLNSSDYCNCREDIFSFTKAEELPESYNDARTTKQPSSSPCT